MALVIRRGIGTDGWSFVIRLRETGCWFVFECRIFIRRGMVIRLRERDGHSARRVILLRETDGQFAPRDWMVTDGHSAQRKLMDISRGFVIQLRGNGQSTTDGFRAERRTVIR